MAPSKMSKSLNRGFAYASESSPTKMANPSIRSWHERHSHSPKITNFEFKWVFKVSVNVGTKCTSN